MKIEVKNLKNNLSSVLRQAGYIFQHKNGKEESWTRPLAGSGYPRFHIYAGEKGKGLTINIHLDRKKETYGENSRHHADYEGEENLKSELERLKGFLK